MKTPRHLLLPVSWLYAAIVAARNHCYDSGIFSVTAVGTPVISVGNITAGGTGKTPLVEFIVATLLGAGARPAVLSRGYRRTTRGTLTVSDGASVRAGADRAGDEPAQIARKFPGCVVVVDEDRVRGARFTESEFHPDVIVLDDGFQHRALRRDLDIVVLGDETAGPDQALLPAGNGREPARALGRADLLVLNRRSGAGHHGVEGKPVIRMRYELKRFSAEAPGIEVGCGELLAGRFVAFCGIGNPGSFLEILAGLGLKPESFLIYPDHHRYGERDVIKIAGALERTGAKYVLTTEKDAVRLEGGTMPQVPFRPRMVVAVIGAVIAEGAEILERAVLGAAGRRAS
ncbi:MAG TPA: tetraacyldisaccharide 4'-kinase [Bacteroidota bacterium]|nr:tetraacyldisaccharide 4'-kinase [Bacteroidota bacterium]